MFAPLSRIEFGENVNDAEEINMLFVTTDQAAILFLIKRLMHGGSCNSFIPLKVAGVSFRARHLIKLHDGWVTLGRMHTSHITRVLRFVVDAHKQRIVNYVVLAEKLSILLYYLD